MRIAYGFDDVEKNKTLIHTAHTAHTLVLEHSKAAVPGRYLVNYLPFLDNVDLPSWVPGAGFKKRFQAMDYKVIHPPFEEVIREVVSACHFGLTTLFCFWDLTKDYHDY
jgi:hypothetical protein